MGAISLIGHLLVIALVFTHSVLDGALDVFLGHVLTSTGSDDSTQCRVVLGLWATGLYGNGNLLAQFGKRTGHVTPSLQFRSFTIFKCSSHWV